MHGNTVGIPRYECMDGCDDGDHGVAEKVMQLLVENNIINRVIFIVRNCGQKLKREENGLLFKSCKKRDSRISRQRNYQAPHKC